MTFTPPGSPAGGFDTMKGELPKAPRFSLLSVVRPMTGLARYAPVALEDGTIGTAPFGPSTSPGPYLGDDGLPSGVQLEAPMCVRSATWPNCPVGLDPTDPDIDPDDGQPWKSLPELEVTHPFYPFMWYSPVGCGFGSSFDRWADLALSRVTAAAAWEVSHQLWTGEANAGTPTDSPSLATIATVIGGLSADPVGPADALDILLGAYHDCDHAGADPTYHVPNEVTTYLKGRGGGIIAPRGAQLIGPLEQLVSRGPGYTVNSGPAGTTTAAGEGWIYLSGPVYAALGRPFLANDPTGQARAAGRQIQGVIEPRTGEQAVIAEQRGIFALDECCVFAIRIQLPNEAVAVA